MSLRLRIHINTVLTIIFILAIFGLVVVQHNAQRKVFQKEDIIQDLTREMVTLSFVTSDYLIFLNERSQTAWLSQFNAMQTLSQQNDEIDSALAPYFASIEEEFGLLVELTDSAGEAEVGTNHQAVLHNASISLYLALQETTNSVDVLQNAIQTDLLRIQRNIQRSAIIYFVLLSAILIAVANSYIRFILRPLNQLMSGVTELESGNFDHQLPIDSGRGAIQSTNELGQLAVAFNRMAKQQQLTMNDLRQELATNLTITERLSASENQFRTIFHIASLGIAQADPATGRLLAVNEGYRSITGYTIEELLSMTIQDITHPEDREVDWDGFSRAMREDDSYVTEKRYIHKDGSVIWVRLNVAFIRNDAGESIITVAICEDISDRKQVEDSLRESEERMRSIFRAAPAGIGLVRDRIIMDVNQRICEMTGYTKGELIGQNARILYPSQEDYEFVGSEKYRQIAQSGTGEVETHWLTRDGTVRDILLASTPLDADDLSKGVTFTALDITERKKAEEYIRNMNEVLENMVQNRTTELQNANEELRSFAYSISHDLRAPLRAIDGFSRILIEEYAEQLTPEAQRYLNLCRENAITMGNLIEGLLEYSRTGRQALHLQMVEPETLVRTVLADLQHEYPDHPANIIIGKLPPCQADPILLKQVYQNLLQNAYKFTNTKPSSQIEIGCDIMEQQSIYYVKDDGVGFDMRYADRLFGVFQRLHRMTEFEGTGIGLAIVQRIIHRLGGKVWCEAVPDNGATFFFTLDPTEGVTNE